MSVRLIGANPGLTLFDEGRVVAFSSLWRVDWSERGAGDALVLWHDGRVRIVAPDVELGRWLADTFVRHFPEVVGLPWPEPDVTTAPVLLELDPATGVRAEAADVVLTITAPLDRRLMTADPVDLGGRPHGFSTVYIPCADGTLELGDRRVAGAPEIITGERPGSSAFLAVAEVWTTG